MIYSIFTKRPENNLNEFLETLGTYNITFKFGDKPLDILKKKRPEDIKYFVLIRDGFNTRKLYLKIVTKNNNNTNIDDNYILDKYTRFHPNSKVEEIPIIVSNEMFLRISKQVNFFKKEDFDDIIKKIILQQHYIFTGHNDFGY